MENSGQMIRNRFLTEAELPGNLAIAFPGGHKLQDFNLPLGDRNGQS